MKEDIKINLSEYYSSILDDESNALLLAWIEKSGTTSEEELSKETAIDEKYVKNIILKLFRNQLIEIYKDSLHISLKGKLVIDSLKLANEIIKNFYSSFDLDAKEELFLNYSLHSYRHNYYDSYLNTCLSLKTWNRIINSSKSAKFDKKETEESFLLIIISDLFQTLSNKSENSNPELLDIFLHDMNTPSSKEGESFKTRKVFKSLKELYMINSKEDFDKYDNSKKEVYEFIRCKDIYLNDEKEQHTLLSAFKNSKEKKLAEATYVTYFNWKNKWLKNTDLNISFQETYSHLFSKKNLKQNQSDLWDTLIFLLEKAETIDGLAVAINKSLSDTKELVLRIDAALNKFTKN